jgi:hypothetical protein
MFGFHTKSFAAKLFFVATIVSSLASMAQANDFATYNTFNPRDNYFQKENHAPEYYRPRTMTPMIAMLPEYSLAGPGYICDNRQAPPVYRLPLQVPRNVGYREADWVNNRLIDRHTHPMNFGGWDY